MKNQFSGKFWIRSEFKNITRFYSIWVQFSDTKYLSIKRRDSILKVLGICINTYKILLQSKIRLSTNGAYATNTWMKFEKTYFSWQHRAKSISRHQQNGPMKWYNFLTIHFSLIYVKGALDKYQWRQIIRTSSKHQTGHASHTRGETK